MDCVTCDFGDALQAGDREGHRHPQVGPHQQQTITDQQAADQHSLVPCREEQKALIFKLKQPTGAGVRTDPAAPQPLHPQVNMHIYTSFHIRKLRN